MGAMIPYISQFAGSLIKPLISELTHGPQQNSQYNQGLIKGFIPKVIAHTPMAVPHFQRNMESAVNQHQYQQAIQYIDGVQKKLGPNNYKLHDPSHQYIRCMLTVS